MHPKALLDSAADLLKQVLRFDHPADAVLSRYFREHRLGPRERATLAETVFDVLRRKIFLSYLAQSGSGPMERRLAILGFPRRVTFCMARFMPLRSSGSSSATRCAPAI